MKSVAIFFETNAGKRLKNLIIGVGASIVLVGALAKLEHWKIAGPMLTIGMLTEAFIFLLLGLLPPHKDYYWERYYPNITEDPHVEAYKKGIKFQPNTALMGTGGGGASATGALDKMLDEAGVTPANLKRLNDNFQRFGETVNQMKDFSNVAAASQEFSNKVNDTSSALAQMKDTFMNTSKTMESFNNASQDAAKFHGQVQVLTKNLGALNNIYEVELNDANNHLKAMNKFYGNLVSASESMASSAEDANRAKDQIAMLAKNLHSLNQIYGNMLSAMQGR